MKREILEMADEIKHPLNLLKATAIHKAEKNILVACHRRVIGLQTLRDKAQADKITCIASRET